MKFNQTVKEFQASVHHALVMLQSDPHFQTLVETWKAGREVMIQQLCMDQVSQSDQDRLRGAIYFADEILRNTKPINNGYGTRNAGVDSYEHEDRG